MASDEAYRDLERPLTFEWTMPFEDDPQAAPHPPDATPSKVQRVREDLRRLGALEVTHVVLGVAVLAVISVRAVFVAEQSIEAMAMALVSVLAFSYLAAAFHFRASQSLLRKDLVGLTLAEEHQRARTDGDHEPTRGDPYRATPPASPIRREADDHLRESASRWRRFALILLVVLTTVLFVSVPMVVHVLMELPHKAGRLH